MHSFFTGKSYQHQPRGSSDALRRWGLDPEALRKLKFDDVTVLYTVSFVRVFVHLIDEGQLPLRATRDNQHGAM